MLKKWISVMLVCCCLALPVLAETDLTGYAIANGTVAATRFEDLTAPFSGTLYPFDLSAGDRVAPEDLLFMMRVTAVTAPENGVVEAVFTAPGEKAEQAMSLYGSVIAIRPALQQQIACIYPTATGLKEENRQVYAGETVYFRSAKTDKTEGSGVVVFSDNSSYLVQILTGSFEKGESLDIYRDDDYTAKKKVGSGKVSNRGSCLIPAAGTVNEILVKPGDPVNAGDTLLTVMGQDADSGASPAVYPSESGVVAMVSAISGQQVWKGQFLARIYLTQDLEIQADVDEMDLHGLRVGDTLPVTLDTDESRILTGTVTKISGLGITRQNAAYYTVHLQVNDRELMIGQSASVYLPKQ